MKATTPRLLLILALATTFLAAAPVQVFAAPAADNPPANDDDRKKDRKKKKKRRKSKKVDMSAIPPDKKAEKKARRAAGEAFKVHRTRHYSVIYDTTTNDVKAFSAAIEKTYRSCMNYTMRLGFEAKPPKKKLLIYYFDRHEAYIVFAQNLGMGTMAKTTAGMFVHGLNQSLFFNYRNHDSYKKAREQAEAKITQLRSKLRGGGLSSNERRRIQAEIKRLRRTATHSNTAGDDTSEMIVQHEVSHQVLYNIGFHNRKRPPANPRWFVEGTAMMFETISRGKSSNIGAVNKRRLRSYRRLEDSGNLMLPLRDFIVTPARFRGPRMSDAYAQGWAMVHYLNRVKRKGVRKYIAIINKRSKGYRSTVEQEIADFEKAFGKLDEKWERKWMNWMKRVN